MSKVIFHARVAFVLLVVCCWSTQVALAQIAPTNSATISGSVSDSGGKPVAHAEVSLSGPKTTSTQTDAQGLFVFVGVPFGTYQISAAATGLGTATRSVAVEGDANIAIQYEPTSMQRLKVIANVSTSSNAQFNVTPASVTQVNPIANAFEGKTSWRKILEQIPGVAQAGLGTGNLNFSALPDGPIMPVQLSINGTLPYETATLLDDMPLISGSLSSCTRGGGGTDLGVYPLNGFGSADVVRGPGASAPSIIDSIGGSFLLRAPGTVSQSHYALSLSTDPYGGIVANALVAVRWHKLSVVATYGVNDSPGPMNNAVIPVATTFSPLTVNGSSLSCTGSCTKTFLYASSNYANFPYYGYSNGLLVCCPQVSTAWSQHGGSVALNYDLSPSVSADVVYAGQTSSQQELTFNDETSIFTPPAGYTGSVPAGIQIRPLSGCSLSLEPYSQASSLLEEKITARVGNGLLRLAALQNRVFSTETFSTPGSDTLQLFGGGSLCSNTSPGCSTGTYTPTIFNGGTYNVTYTPIHLNLIQESDNRDLLFGYTIPLGENLHAGASFVRSYYDIPCQEAYTYGAPYNLVGGASIPSDASQTTNELRIFLGGTPSAKTSIDLSGYFVNADYHVANPIGYSSVTGRSSNGWLDQTYTYAAPRLGFVWRPTATIAVRASAGGGFAEAPLSYLVGSSGTPTLSTGGYYTVTLTNVNLQPEKSFGFDFGTDIRLHRNTVLSFDVYHTNLYGQFYRSTVTGTYLGLPLYTTQYGNLGESRYEGVLLDVRHDTPHGIYWALSGGLTRGYVVNVPAGFYNAAGTTCNFATNVGCKNQSVVPGVNFNGAFTGVSVPYSQGLGTFGYRWNAEKYVDLVGTYFGNNNTYFRPAFVELDGDVSYPISKNASLVVTFRNITGIYDGSIGVFTSGNFIGVPTVSGLPYALYGQQYGPRTVILTTIVHL